MGMYTEIMVRARVRPSAPQAVVDLLRAFFDSTYLLTPEEIQGMHPLWLTHPLFQTERWTLIGRSGSYYHFPEPVGRMWEAARAEGYYIFHRSDFKNYGDEIALFFDWAAPYLEPCNGEILGWGWYEEDARPVFYGADGRPIAEGASCGRG